MASLSHPDLSIKPIIRILLFLALIIFSISIQSCGPSQEQIRIGALEHFNRGNAFLRSNNPKDAVAEFRMAIELDDTQAAFHYNLGLAYYRLVLYDLAIASYQQAIHIKPDFAEAWYNLSLALDKVGETEKAFIAYDRYQKLNQPQPPEIPKEKENPQGRATRNQPGDG